MYARYRRGFVLSVAVAAGLLVFLGSDFNPRVHADPATRKTLGGEDRYLTHLSTDKPIYRGGETVYVRGVMLDAHQHKPLMAPQAAVWPRITVKGPRGEQIASGTAQLQDGALAYQWLIPQGQAGGEYTLQVRFPRRGYAPAERKFDIRAYRAPRLKTQIQFLRDGYGPGDTVQATVEATRAEGGVPAGAEVTVTARVDGTSVYRKRLRIGDTGRCTARFELPQKISRGEGSLSFAIRDGGVVETATKTIPILLQTVDLDLYPEGGDLVVGLPTRVYIEARTPADKPADIAGEIVDDRGKTVARYRTEHEGRGRVAITPQSGRRYTLRITEPAGIKTTYPLPQARTDGAVLSSLVDRTPADQGIGLRVGLTQAGTYKLELRKREQVVADEQFTYVPGARGQRQVFVLRPQQDVDGVLVATLWDDKGRPLAERLVFRESKREVRVQVTPERDRYVPGDLAAVRIKTTDAQGNPVSAVVGLSVTDDSVLEMIETREQAPRLRAMALLEPDVRELADTTAYFKADAPHSALAVDLLLGTQGWRRFAVADADRFLAGHGDAARRALAWRQPQRVHRRMALVMEDGAALRAPVAMPAGAEPPPEPRVDQQHAELAEAAAPPKHAPVEMPAVRQRRAAREIRMDKDMEDEAMAWAPRPVYRRIYAHEVRPNRKPNERVDFTETLYWCAGIKTDEKTGEALVQFGLSDAVTSFRVRADAYTADGALGEGDTLLESVRPFYIEPKLPLEVTQGDRIDLPVALTNATDAALDVALLARPVDAAKTPWQRRAQASLKADSGRRVVLPLDVGSAVGQSQLTFAANAGEYSDTVTRPLTVVAQGFPVETATGGIVSARQTPHLTLQIPQDVVPGSMETHITVQPNPLGNLTSALERLIRDPHGCFEQTSSTTYPLVMAQQYFARHPDTDPEMVRRSLEKLERGYKRLTSFECDENGYEWFGADPGHEALTAYGLMEFHDMAAVRPVDPKMLARTRAWIKARRDGEGGFTRERRALHTWIEDKACSNAYITWALLETGETGLEKEVDWVRRAAAETKNSYVLALAANVLHLAGDTDGARGLMRRLAGLQNAKGRVTGGTTSIVGSRGQALTIETTALAALAWLREPEFHGNAGRTVEFLASCCKGGRYGSTQSTVLTLRAILAAEKELSRPETPGQLRVLVDGLPVGEPLDFDQSAQGTLQLPDVSELLESGEHTISVKMTDGNPMPAGIAVNYHAQTPPSSPECRLALTAALRDTTLQEGAVTEVDVTVRNRKDEALPMCVAIVGLPGGLEPHHDQLKELVKSGQVAAYEVRGREVVLYWRDFAAGQTRKLSIRAVAAVPGSYTGPASRAYEYYTDEHKHWVRGLKATIKAQ